MLQPLQVRLKGARDVCIWHFCDITRALGGVRFRGQTGKHFSHTEFPSAADNPSFPQRFRYLKLLCLFLDCSSIICLSRQQRTEGEN